MRREVRATANRLANFDDANLRRSARAAVAAGARVERAMAILGACPKPVLVSAGGLVFSPWTRADFAGGVLGLRTLDESEYLVFLTPAPGRPARLVVEGLGARQALALLGNETGAVARLQVH